MKKKMDHVCLVDEDDNVLETKLITECRQKPFLRHRTFSLFVTWGDKWLMVQQSHDSKINPCMWTAVCSYPCDNVHPMEHWIYTHIPENIIEKLEFLGRIEYKLIHIMWGEHAIDHVYRVKSSSSEPVSYKIGTTMAWWTTEEINQRIMSDVWNISPQFRVTWVSMQKLNHKEILRIGSINANATENRDFLIDLPFRYISGLRSKNIRTMLVKLLQPWSNMSDADTLLLSETVQDLHNASLLADDIEDHSETRRGALCAHHLFGIPLSMNAYGFAMVRTVAKMGARSPEAATLLSEALVCLHRGQGTDIYWTETGYQPTIQEYMDMVQCKTGALFTVLPKIATLLGSTFSPDIWSERYKLLGVYFQIRDDFCNACDPVYWLAKGFFEDMEEGKLSYMVLLALCKTDIRPRLLQLLQMKKNISIHEKRETFWLLHESGALHETYEFLLCMYDQLCDIGPLMKSLYVPKVPIVPFGQ